jgi:RNA methyltransferase, TrmH family
MRRLLDDVLALRARKGLDPDHRLLLEGLRLVGAARTAALMFDGVIYTPEFSSGPPCLQLLQALQRDGISTECVPPRVFSKISYKAEGLVAVVRHALPSIDAVLATPRVLVLDGLSDPGNIGAVLRSANAWGPAAVVVVGGSDKLFHPKCLRASMGAVFHTPVAVADRASLVPRIAALGRPVVVLSPDGAPLATVARDAIVVVGNERYGVHPAFHDVTTSRVALPMTGIVDSLNVATSAAIVLWETFAD